MPTAGLHERILRGRVSWHPRRVEVRLPDGRRYQFGAKPYWQAVKAAKKLNLEFRVLSDRVLGFARQRI